MGLSWARVQVVQKNHPMKCAGVAGRQVRSPGELGRLPSLPPPGVLAQPGGSLSGPHRPGPWLARSGKIVREGPGEALAQRTQSRDTSPARKE